MYVVDKIMKHPSKNWYAVKWAGEWPSVQDKYTWESKKTNTTFEKRAAAAISEFRACSPGEKRKRRDEWEHAEAEAEAERKKKAAEKRKKKAEEKRKKKAEAKEKRSRAKVQPPVRVEIDDEKERCVMRFAPGVLQKQPILHFLEASDSVISRVDNESNSDETVAAVGTGRIEEEDLPSSANDHRAHAGFRPRTTYQLYGNEDFPAFAMPHQSLRDYESLSPSPVEEPSVAAVFYPPEFCDETKPDLIINDVQMLDDFTDEKDQCGGLKAELSEMNLYIEIEKLISRGQDAIKVSGQKPKLTIRRVVELLEAGRCKDDPTGLLNEVKRIVADLEGGKWKKDPDVQDD